MGDVRMRWLPDNISIEIQTQDPPTPKAPWLLRKILLQPAFIKKEIGLERIPCLFVGTLDSTVEEEVNMLKILNLTQAIILPFKLSSLKFSQTPPGKDPSDSQWMQGPPRRDDCDV